MKVQLFVPPGGYFAERWTKGSSMPPLGLLSIAAVLEKHRIEVRIVPADMQKLGWKEIKQEIKEFVPDVIGITSVTENRFQSFKLIRLAKRTLPSAVTILGGPHASMAAEDTLKHIPELDVVVRGEGEMTMLELCEVFSSSKNPSSLASVTGISYRNNGEVRKNPPRDPIIDLNSLPSPAFHLIPFEDYNFRFPVPGRGNLSAINVMTSRGCPFNCNFCATPITWGRRVRMRSPENVIEEIESLKERYGIQVVFFFDDTFNANPERARQICDLIIQKKLDIFWKCDIRNDLIDRDLLARMKEAGLFHLSFGLEAGSERVRNQIVNKKVDIDDFHNLIQWCRELEIVPNPFFIFSHPTETWEEAQETIQIIEQYPDDIEASVAILHIYPGTPLEKTAREQGVLPKNFSWTKKYHPKIITLPTAQGDVPLYKDRLTWAQISELVFRWSFSGGKFAIFSKIPRILLNVRSPGDFYRYLVMAWVYLRLKLQRLIKKSQ